MIDSAALYAFGMALIFVGVLIIVIAIILLSVLGGKNGKVKAGLAIIIIVCSKNYQDRTKAPKPTGDQHQQTFA